MPEFSQDMMNSLQAFWPIILMVVIFYFLLYRPQKKEQKRRQEMLNSLKKNDKVLTAGGIYGTITAINDKTATVRIADKVEVQVLRTSLSLAQNQAD